MASPTITVPIKSVFDPADEEITLPPEHPRVSRAALIDRFSRLLGRSELPVAEWRAVGDLGALDETVRSTVQWLTDATRYKAQVPELPTIPHEDVTLNGVKTRIPAAGTRSVFNECVAGWRGGLTPAQVQSSWNTAKRQVLARTRNTPGMRTVR